MDRGRKDASSTSQPRPSPRSRASLRGSRTSASPGSPTLGRAALRALAERHGVRPSKSLGQNFLVDPAFARRIASLAEVGEGQRVVEVGAGLGSLTVALAGTGAGVLAIEVDRRALSALEEVCAGMQGIRLLHADALSIDWPAVLGEGPWTMASNLPYNVATPLLLRMLERASQVRHYLVMVQREVGERLAAGPGDAGYGAVSVKVAYRATAAIVRRVPATVFWPAPRVESVLVRLIPHVESPISTDEVALFRIVDEGFAERRKMMRNALRRLGMDSTSAGMALERAGLDSRARAEEIGLEGFARLTEIVAEEGPISGGRRSRG